MSVHDNVYINTDERLFYLSDYINNESVGKLNYWLLKTLKDDDNKELREKNFKRKPIKFYINSYGGDVHDMWGLIDIMLNSQTPIYTYCTGYAMSAAFLIFLAGHKRFATKHATFMYHQMSCFKHEKYQDFIEYKEEIDYLEDELEKFVIQRTNLSKKSIENNRITKKDLYIHPKEALKYKIIDKII